LDDKDKAFIEAYHSARPLDPSVIEERIRLSNFDSPIADRAFAYIRNLTQIAGSGGEATGGPSP
jgi:ABC-type microcin C transport system permease subunit YejB